MKTSRQHFKISNCITTIAGVVFRLICSIHGLEAGFSKLRRVSLPFWFVVAVAYPFTIFVYVLDKTYLTSENVSLSVVTGLVGTFNYVVSTLTIMHALILNHKVVERLIRTDVKDVGDVFVPIACSVPLLLFCIAVIGRIDEIPVVMGYLCYVGFDFSATVFFMIYSNVCSNILVQLRELHELIQGGDTDWDSVLLGKLRIRREIETVNSIFARAQALNHIQLFQGTIFDLASAMGDNLLIYEKCLLMASLFTYLTVLAYVAQKGSRVISQCVETELQIWTLAVSRADLRNSGRQPEMVGIFRFREEWDTFRVACFTSSLGNFFMYLSTTVTCVAVVLQFDYKVVRTITNLAAVPSP